MTDLDKFIELYKSFDIDISNCIRIIEDKKVIEIGRSYIDNPKINGYGGCATEVVFTMNGEFISQGFYEE